MFKIITHPLEQLLPNFVWQRLIKRLPFDRIQFGSLTIRYRNEAYRFEGAEDGVHADLTITAMLRFLFLLKTQGELGVTQAYVEHTIDSPSLYHLMTFAHQNRQALAHLLNAQKPLGWWHLWQHRRRHNSLQNSRRNIAAHYDLGNDFYRLWLDSGMTYSSGIFENDSTDLAQSQRRKYQRIFEQLDLQPGETILEIGCGWGGFLEAAAQRNVRTKGLTLSTEQRQYAEERLAKQELSVFAQPVLQDYRHETGQYDHIVSIEMFEAVGREYWDTYFTQLQQNLKPGGKAVLQIITIDEAVAEDYQNSVDFIQAYIFPGGLLPSLTQLKQLAVRHHFDWLDDFAFGQDYATTLQHWQTEFNKHTLALESLGYDVHFRRLWRYYLDYCRVGFEQEHISVYQITLQKQSPQEVCAC
jgi:cyclopropane-fatty-acyl-phospholipid synthase